MTNKVQKEETPNPYNANKPWHNEEDKPFTSSNEMYFEEPQNKLFDSNDITINSSHSNNQQNNDKNNNINYAKEYQSFSNSR